MAGEVAARRVKARPSFAAGWTPAGYTARRLVTKVKTPFFNDLRTMTSLCIRFGLLLGWVARGTRRPSFHFWA